jgi:prevent-host-death family protein
MDEIPISKFKATCLAVLERVRATNQPIRVTRFGKPIADIMPPSSVEKPRRSLGTLAGMMTIHGDIVSSVIDESDFEAAQDWPTNELNKDRFRVAKNRPELRAAGPERSGEPGKGEDEQ